MTPAQHRALGRLLGFPDCCVEAWVSNGNRGAVERGCVVLGHRLPGYADAIREQVAAILGTGSFFAREWPDRACGDDARICFVPCQDCLDAGNFLDSTVEP